MIKRTYFFVVESKPLLKQKRLADGKVTVATGTITHKSWFPDENKIHKGAINKSASDDIDFLEDEIMVMAIIRL